MLNFIKKLTSGQPIKELPEKQTIELIENKLSVTVFIHEVQCAQHDHTIKTLAFLTDGLYALGQKELFFVLKNKKQSYTEIPQNIMQFFKDVFTFASEGNFADIGGYTHFEKSDIFGWKGLAYTLPPKHLQDLFAKPTLNMLLLSDEEIMSYLQCGPLRTLSLLGAMFRYFPTPYWSDIKRNKLPIQPMMQRSVILNINRIVIPFSTVTYDQVQDIITLKMPAAFDITPFKEGTLTDSPIAILPLLDEKANGCLAFSFDGPEKGPEAIAPENSDGSLLAGCMLTLLPGQDEFDSRVFEDGFSLMLTDQQWDDFWKAFFNKEPFEIRSQDKMSFQLTWS